MHHVFPVRAMLLLSSSTSFVLLLAPVATGLPVPGPWLRARSPTLGLVTSILDGVLVTVGDAVGAVGDMLGSVVGGLQSRLTPDSFTPPGLLDPQSTKVAAPIVDLGYARYQGYYNEKVDMNIYRGIRFAAPPKRWQLPTEPEMNRTAVILAVNNPPRCPQSPYAPRQVPAPPLSNVESRARLLTASRQDPFSFDDDVLGDEDCLFLNVFQPAKATDSGKLPVMVYIHGGGYNQFEAGMFDFSFMDQSVGNGFVTVLIQYRLGAFGFASSAAIARRGVPNAGLHDQRFALRWVQRFAGLFGGDAARVTIAGESAGGGSVMLMAMANGGDDGTTLWTTGIASSPYLPGQPDHDGPEPSEAYRQLAVRAGCVANATANANGTTNARADVDDDAVFDCLSAAPTLSMQKASADVNLDGKYGQWAFKPVTDGTLVRARPSAQLLAGRVNGKRMLVGNNANEGGRFFVPQNITTEQDFRDYVLFHFPGLRDGDNLAAVLALYAVPAALEGLRDDQGLYASNGLTPPYATVMSHTARGWQQAADNLFAEATFVCPAYWLGDAYAPALLNLASTSSSPGPPPAGGLLSSLLVGVGSVASDLLGQPATREDDVENMAWRYQFSVPDALHGADMIPLQADPATDAPGGPMDATFGRAFQSLWGGMVMTGRPNLPPNRTQPEDGNNVTAAEDGEWKPWGSAGAVVSPMLNVNATEDGRADWAVVDGLSWEGGRAARCAMWAGLGAVVQV